MITNWLKDFNLNETVFAMEHTGYYGAALAWVLSEQAVDFYIHNPLDLKKSLGIQRGKTDSIDAYRIASYTIANHHRLSLYSMPTQELIQLKALMAARERYVKISVMLKNSLKANQILNETISVKTIISEEKKQIKNIKKAKENVENQMQEIINSNTELKNSYEKISRVIGVGPVTAVKCITETDNFLKFSNAENSVVIVG